MLNNITLLEGVFVNYKNVMEKYNDIMNLDYALSLLNWDQSTCLTNNGVIARANITETLSKIQHDLITSDEFYKELSDLERQDLKESEKEIILKIKEDVEKERKIPVRITCELSRIISIAIDLWQKAKNNNNDKEFLPVLEKIFEIKKEIAGLLGYKENPYDALIDYYDEGLTFRSINPLFNLLKNELIEIIEYIDKSNNKINDEFLYFFYDREKQINFGLKILEDIGIVFDSFRQDESAHPFTTKLGNGDIRITTKIFENNFKSGFFSTLHEGGHALYEIGVSNIFNESPFANIKSLSLHESQSRFYENIVGRNKNFWHNYYPMLRSSFPEVLNNIKLDDFYNAINKVYKNPIRIESDEVTYNLHIILRTILENKLINDKMKVSDINEAWNEETKAMFGFYPEDKSSGYLQDIHWASGLIGYFPTYSIGNLISAQILNKLKQEFNDVDNFNKENLNIIFNWFNNNLYRLGSKKNTMDVIKQITGEELNSKYFIEYIKNKYREIY